MFNRIEPLASGYRASARRRAPSLVIALGITALVVLLLMRLVAPYALRKPDQPNTFTYDVPGADTSDKPRAIAVKAKPKGGKQSPEQQQHPVTPPRQQPPVPAPVEDKSPLNNVLYLTKRDFASADIGKAPPAPPGGSSAKGDQGDGRDSGAADSAVASGHGPAGQRLYVAEWYRRPTDAELSPYLPRDFAGSGWGLISCRTAPGYRVEDCQELGDSPPGSRLAGAVRQAAWQFRVRPPRVGGKEMVGEWVAIRITYGRRPAP